MVLAILIALYQLTDAYIRLIPFRISAEIKKRLLLNYLAVCVVSFILYGIIFTNQGINATTYKIILLTGWLPYFLIALRFLGGIWQHVFVFGMAAICSLVQHTISTMIILLHFDNLSNYELISYVAVGYLLLFLPMFPIYKRYFMNLLPSREIFEFSPQIAILPLIIVSAHLIRLADDILVHSWAERLSRLYLPVTFFFFYRYILVTKKKFYEFQKSERNKHQLEEQLSILQEYNEQIEKNQKFISIMRHDLRHNYNLIHSMLKSGLIAEAREHIKKQEKILESSKNE